MENMTSLFLSQSYSDMWEDYGRSLTDENFAVWDYIVLTASNEQQAEGFRNQIKARADDSFLPARTRFIVIPDPDGKRVGSGGATLCVLRYIAEERGSSDFSGLRILVIHSGGDSKRIPQYSALGKLFSPVPHELPNGRASTLFDEFMIAMASVPSRIRGGMLLLSGDVLLLFNPLQIDFSGRGAAAISFKENVLTGSEHGVFLRDENGNVKRFLHKLSPDALSSCGAVDSENCVDIDTGAVIFSPEILSSLYALISTEGVFDIEKFRTLVNERVRLSLYGDFLYPLATDSTLEDFYLEKPEWEYGAELNEARERVWAALSPYRMKLLRLAPAKFIHFGTTGEIMELMEYKTAAYRSLGWSRMVCSSINAEIAGYNSVAVADAKIGDGCYFETSYVSHGAVIGDHVLLSYVEIHEETVPSNVVLHGLKQRDGKFVVRIYGIYDNPKMTLENGCTFLTGTLDEFIRINDIAESELWDTDDRSLWTAKLYPTCDTISDAIAAALNIYRMMFGEGDIEAWRRSERKSLCAGFNDADTRAIVSWNRRMMELVRIDCIVKRVLAGEPADGGADILREKSLTKIQRDWLSWRMKYAGLFEKMRLNYYTGQALGGGEGNIYIADSFNNICEAVLAGTSDVLSYNENCRIVTDRHTVSLPLRVNFGGGWSDTPPYCIENGGTVVNAAILLNGRKPVEVTMSRISEHKIVFESSDMDVHGEFYDIKPLQGTGDPYDPFALQKACLTACGIIPRNGGNLDRILTRLGGGFVMHSEVKGVPQGSGLGTSSILSAACVKAVLEFTGISYTDEDICSRVMGMEQIMSTGGGWQDQAGGLHNGIKYITTMPGVRQKLDIHNIVVPADAMRELNERYALIYTGQRRLARNLLREVIGRYVGNDPEAVFALNEVQRTAALMRFELERGHIDDFAGLLDRHWELSVKIDAGSTNTLIDLIFRSIDDLICGKMICGAGGGGFLQVIMKKNVTRDDIHERLKAVFRDNDIDVWDCTLI